MDLKTFGVLGENVTWKRHEGYFNDQWQAESMAQFYKDQIGYSAVTVLKEQHEYADIFTIFVLVSK